MSVARSSKCVFCTLGRAVRPVSTVRRGFHSSPNIRSSDKSSKKDEVSIERDSIRELTKEEANQNYTPQQAQAIEITNKNFTADIKNRTLPRQDPWSLEYFDDFVKIDPVVDKPVKAPWTNIDENYRLKTEEEFDEDMRKFMETMPQDEKLAAQAWSNFEKNLRLTVGKEENELNPRSAMAPDLPKMSKPKKKTAARDGAGGEQGSEPSPALVRLMQMTGYNQDQLRKIRVKSIISHRVVNQTRLGKIGKQYYLSIAGNGNGLIGVGEGKSEEPSEGMIQSQYRAIRNMQPILRYENRTIFGDVKGKSGATELELFTRPPGFGLRCQQYIWEICKCAGISDLAARVTRARNPMNTVKATVQALLSQKDPEDIARARGKKLVDVRKVYYAGNV